MTDQEWAALCELCEWSATCKNEEVAKIVTVLHAIRKHPENYHQATGRDPEEAEAMYKELFETFKADL